MTLVESSLRKLVSATSVAWIISKNASAYLHAGSQHDEQVARTAAALKSSEHEEGSAMPDLMATSLKEKLASEVEKYGLEIERIEIQEVRLPQEIQEAIDRVWKATLLPAQTEQEAIARVKQLEAELGTVAKILGTEAAGKVAIAEKMQGMNFYGGLGGFGAILEQLLGGPAKKPDSQLPKLQDGQQSPALQAGPEWTEKPKP
jgi:regulator of protease activity HflC (stomatin/prohibitin superfamily)